MTTHTATLEKLKEVIGTVTNAPVGDINPEGDIRSQLNLDSMQFVQLFTALELEFGVELPLSIMNVSKVSDFIEILESTINEIV